MGFSPYTEAKFTFEDGDRRFAGAEITMLVDVALGDLMAYMDLGGTLAERWEWHQKNTLRGWNLEGPNAEPLPLDTPAEKLPRALLQRLMTRWMAMVMDLDTPFAPPSPGGDT